MKKKLSLSKENWFQIVNTIIVLAIMTFYFGRLFYYKEKMTITYTDTTSDTLSHLLIARNDVLKEDRLYQQQDGSYVFKGMVNDNYCLYENALYRIVGIDKDGNVKIVSDDCLTSLTLENDGTFEQSSIYKWLNKIPSDNLSGIYFTDLSNKSNIVETKANLNIVDDINNYSSDLYLNCKVTILSIEDYLLAGADKSYLVNGQSFWLSNCNSNYDYYYIDENGAIGTAYSTNQLSGVRAVLTLDSSLIALSGKGSKEDPYILYKKTTAENISFTKPGDYIIYSDQKWIIESKESGNAVLMLDGVIETDGEVFKRNFGAYNYLNKSSGVGRYINEDYLSTLYNYQAYLLENNWNCGMFTQLENYDFQQSYNDSFTAYVSIPAIGCRYLFGEQDYFLANSTIQSEDMILVYRKGILYANFLQDKAAIRPMILMNKNIKITSGDGSYDNPYMLEVIE